MISFNIFIVIIKPTIISSNEIKIRIDTGNSGRKDVNNRNDIINGIAPSNVNIKSVLKHSIRRITTHRITIIITISTIP